MQIEEIIWGYKNEREDVERVAKELKEKVRELLIDVSKFLFIVLISTLLLLLTVAVSNVIFPLGLSVWIGIIVGISTAIILIELIC